ncbi:MAG: nitrate ABC transporter, permease protein, partial [Phreatobacter sp.]|nr:nitrate ABC transporter, permease protein [Phreatobacter sp.]
MSRPALRAVEAIPAAGIAAPVATTAEVVPLTPKARTTPTEWLAPKLAAIATAVVPPLLTLGLIMLVWEILCSG